MSTVRIGGKGGVGGRSTVSGGMVGRRVGGKSHIATVKRACWWRMRGK